MVSEPAGCGEAIKEAVDRNTGAQLERAQTWNALVGKALEANQLKQQTMLGQLKEASAFLRGSGSGQNGNFGNGSDEIKIAEIACPPTVVNTGSTHCYAVPPQSSTPDIQRLLRYLQEQARAQGLNATFAATEDDVVGLVAIVDSRRTQ